MMLWTFCVSNSGTQNSLRLLDPFVSEVNKFPSSYTGCASGSSNRKRDSGESTPPDDKASKAKRPKSSEKNAGLAWRAPSSSDDFSDSSDDENEYVQRQMKSVLGACHLHADKASIV